MYVRADVLKQRNARFERARLEREEEERRRLEAQRQAEEAQRKAGEFEAMIARWRLARDIREFCEQVRGMAGEAHCTIKRGGWVEELLTFGDSYATKMDPLTPLAQELAGHVARHKAALAARDGPGPDPKPQPL
jgi:uncharacterized cupin superfamily protein